MSVHTYMGWTLRQWIIAAAFNHTTSFYNPSEYDVLDAARVQAHWRSHRMDEPGDYEPLVIGIAVRDEDRDWGENALARAEELLKEQKNVFKV